MLNNSSGIYFFQGFSLVDITATGVIRSANDNELERNQQRNWETVVQCIGLRAQPQNIEGPVELTVDLEHYQFGDFYTGQQKIWTWTWSIEQHGVYDVNGGENAGLAQDFEQVPIVTGLTETARFMLPIFYPYGTIKNIYFITVNLDNK